MAGWTLFTWIVFDLFFLALKTQLTWLRENHWISILTLCDTAYLIKGSTYGLKYNILIAMLSPCATFMILLAALKEIESTFLSNVILMTMRFYFLMLKV